MPDDSLTPTPRAGVRFEEMDGEAVVYDRGGKKAIYLSESATVIWKLCDGQRSVGEIVATLAREYPEAATEIAADVSGAVDRMVAAQVLRLAKRAPAEGSTAAPA